LLAGNVAGVGASDQQGVQPWLAARLDYTPPVPDAKGCGFNLVGGRVDDLAGRRVAALVYQRGESVIDLFVWPTTQNQNGKLSVLSRQGYSLIHWERDGMTWWAVSNDNAAELRSFVSHINPQS
jgi:anti-sigma factor RsiW